MDGNDGDPVGILRGGAGNRWGAGIPRELKRNAETNAHFTVTAVPPSGVGKDSISSVFRIQFP